MPADGATGERIRTAPSDGELRRMANVYRRWVTTSKQEERRSGASRMLKRDLHRFVMDPEDAALRFAFSLSFLCLPTGFALKGWEAPLELPTEMGGGTFIGTFGGPWLAVSLLVVSLLGGWLIEQVLFEPADERHTVRRSVRWLRWAATSIPVLGLFGAPALWSLGIRRGWFPEKIWQGAATCEPAPTLRLGVHHPPAISAKTWRGTLARRILFLKRRFLDLWWLVAWLILCAHFVVPYIWLDWLAFPEEMTRGRYAAVVGVAVMLHLLGFLSMTYAFAVRELRHRANPWATAPLWVPLLGVWLAPGFTPLLGFVLYSFIGRPLDRTAAEASLAGSVDPGGRGGGRLSSLAGLEEVLGRRWTRLPWKIRFRPPKRLEKTEARERSQTYLLRISKSKSITVFFDTLVLTLLLGLGTERFSSLVDWTLLGATVLFLAGLVVQLLYLASRVTRTGGRLRVLDRHPYAFYLVVTQGLFLAGWRVGSSLAEGETGPAVGALTGIVVAGLLATVSNSYLPPARKLAPRRFPENALWFSFFAGGTAGTYFLYEDLTIQGAVLDTLVVLAVVAPVVSAVFAAFLLSWLLRPFELRQVFDRRIARRHRLLLAVLTLTALLPLGGLLAPWWIYVHHRVWPRLLARQDEEGVEWPATALLDAS